MKYEFLAGLEYLKEDSHRKALQNFGTAAAPAFYPYQEAITGAPVDFNGKSYALYLQDTIEFIAQWKATMGIRHDQLDATYSSITSPQSTCGALTAFSVHGKSAAVSKPKATSRRLIPATPAPCQH